MKQLYCEYCGEKKKESLVVEGLSFCEKHGTALNKEFLNQILFRRQAEELAKMSPQAFQNHVRKGHIVPAKEHGTGKGKAQLFWREDIDNLKKGNYPVEP